MKREEMIVSFQFCFNKFLMISAGSYFHAQNRSSTIRNQISMDNKSFPVNLWNTSLSGKCWQSHHTDIQHFNNAYYKCFSSVLSGWLRCFLLLFFPLHL